MEPQLLIKTLSTRHWRSNANGGWPIKTLSSFSSAGVIFSFFFSLFHPFNTTVTGCVFWKIPFVPEQGPWRGMRRRHFSQREPATVSIRLSHRAQICMPKRSFPSRDDGHGPPFWMSNPFAMLITSAVRFPPAAAARVRLAPSRTLLRPHVTCRIQSVTGKRLARVSKAWPYIFPRKRGRRSTPSPVDAFRNKHVRRTQRRHYIYILLRHPYLARRYTFRCTIDTLYWFLFSVRAPHKRYRNTFLSQTRLSISSISSGFRTLGGGHDPAPPPRPRAATDSTTTIESFPCVFVLGNKPMFYSSEFCDSHW